MNSNKIYVVAEMACSHDGSMDHAKTIIDGAGQARADAIQLQIWALGDMMAPGQPVYEICKKLEFSQPQWKQMVEYSRTKYPEMEILCFIYEHKSIGFVEGLNVDGYKLSSADLSNPYMLERIASTGKKIHLSVGASSLTEIQSAIERIRKISKAPIRLMYGYQSFPTKIDDIHLSYMMKLSQMFGLPLGYQDHCDAETQSAFWIPALAVGMGVSVLEKHITHNRAAKGVDHESALNPDEFKTFVNMVRELERAKGISTPKPFSADELKYRQFQKKSIVAAQDLKAGDVLTEAHVNFLRAAELGLAPDQLDKLLNKRLNKNIARYGLLREGDVA